LREMCSGANQSSPFDYLRRQCINSTSSQVEEYIRRLNTKYVLCLLFTTYPQCKIPCGTITVSASDQQAGKKIGLVQIQAYNLALLLEGCDDDEQLVGRLQQEIDAGGTGLTVGAHLCKRICLNVAHIARLSSHTNVKFHDSCPAYWVINGNLINFCSCSTVKKCIGSTPAFVYTEFARSIGYILSNTSSEVV